LQVVLLQTLILVIRFFNVLASSYAHYSNEGTNVTLIKFCRKAIRSLSISFLVVAFAVPQVAQAENAVLPADAPYQHLLVIALAKSFDIRRYLETEIVKELEKKGTTAVRSTSLMNSKVPMVRETFLAQVEEVDADAVLVTQLADLKTKGTIVDMNPQATYNIRPTWYFNVWSVELTEYVAPPAMNYDHKLTLATQLYSVQSKEAVWAMESTTDIMVAFDKGPDYSIFVKEAAGIIKELRKSKMIAR